MNFLSQFAVVHYFTKYGSGECYFGMELSSDSSSDEHEWSERRKKRVSNQNLMNLWNEFYEIFFFAGEPESSEREL